MPIQREAEAREFASDLPVTKARKPSHSGANDQRKVQPVPHRWQPRNSPVVR